MAFTPVLSYKGTFGNKRVHRGTFVSSGGDTGGDITTGLAVVEDFFITEIASAVTTGAPVVNEILPLVNTGGVVTIVTDANVTGRWMAIGI